MFKRMISLISKSGRAAKHARLMMGASAISQVVALGSQLVLMWEIDADGFGRFAVAMATIGVVVTLCSLRFGTLLITINDDEMTPDLARHLRHAIFQESAFLTVIAGSWLAIAGLWTTLNVILLVTMLASQWIMSHRALYERSQDYVNLARLEIWSQVACHGSAVVFALAGLGETSLYLRQVVLVVVLGVGLAWIGGIRWDGMALLSFKEWGALLQRVKGLWAEGVLESLFGRAQVLVAGAVGGEAGAGYFSQAMQLVVRPHQLLSPLVGRLALNWFSRESSAAERIRRRKQLVRLAAGILIVAVAGNFLLADFVVPLIFGERWRPAVIVMWALSGFLLFNSLVATHKMYLMATERTGSLVMARMFQFCGLLIPLVPYVVGHNVEVWVAAVGVSVGWALCFVTTSWRIRTTDADAAKLT